MDTVVAVEHRRAAVRVRAALALLARCEDARALGLDPADPASAAAIAAEPALEALLRQGPEQAAPIRTLEALRQTADMLEEAHGYQL
jgi:flagellar biosynthesis/type III secretory pathway ATPase